MVFDTSDPVDGDCGDIDLGSPNVRCNGGGPGKGEDGEPDGRGPNCKALGNALIVQEPGEDCPDDNVDGGMMEFEFEPMVDYIESIGLLDVDYEVSISITFMNAAGEMDDTTIIVPVLGDNSYQLLPLDIDQVTGPVKKLTLDMTRSAAVTSLKFCPPSGPMPTPGGGTISPPTKSPPTPSPPTKAPPTPTGGSTCVKVDFRTSAGGKTLSGGEYVDDDWEEYGLTLSAAGGRGSLPRLFNTSSVGNDPDLGSPNKKCPNSDGPGEGKGGEPDGEGPNCNDLGLVLIVQSSDTSITIPDDNVDGGSILFEFAYPVFFESLGLLDMDYATSITILTETESGGMEELPTLDVDIKGDNSFQLKQINEDKVKQLRVSFTRSGAVTEINFCPSLVTPTPAPPTKSPPTKAPPTKAPPTTTPATAAPPTPSGESQCIYINAGGPDYLDPDGVTWVKDTGFYNTGSKHSTDAAIYNTNKPDLYQSERYASEMRYEIETSNAEYIVRLHFAEIYDKAFKEGARVFDVFIEGELVADNLDVYKEAGDGNTAYILVTTDVIVSDGSLTVDFVGVQQKAKISAIEICKVTDGSPAPSASPSESPSESPSKAPTFSEYRRRANLRFGFQT